MREAAERDPALADSCVHDGEFSGRCVTSRGPNFVGDPPTFPATIAPLSVEPTSG